MRKRILSWLLAMLLVIQAMTTSVYAADSSVDEELLTEEEIISEAESGMETVSSNDSDSVELIDEDDVLYGGEEITVQATNLTYSVSAALEYAKANVYNDVGLCAEFVSRCVQAGGLGNTIQTGTGGLWRELTSITGLTMIDLKLGSNGMATQALDGDILAPGDVVMQWCYDCNISPHALICGGYNSAGNATYYARNGTKNNQTYKLSVNEALHPNCSNIGGKVIRLSTLELQLPAPVVNSVEIVNVNGVAGTFQVQVIITSEAGLDRVQFPAWTDSNGQDDLASDWMTNSAASGSLQSLGNNTYLSTFTVSIAEHNNEHGNYTVHIYAYDTAGKSAFAEISFYFADDSTPPVISDISISDVNGSGYTVNCTVVDNIEVDRVQFPTWTEKDGQDDLVADWWTNPVVSGTRNGNTFSFRVKDSEHSFERGNYITHIYAYDTYGNCSYVSCEFDFQNLGCVVAETTYNEHVYQIIDDKVTWEEAKQICESVGGHLVTITSVEEQQAIMSVIPNETTSVGYFIGGYSNNGIPCWVTEEPFEYTNWLEGEPNNSDGSENVYELYRNSGELFGKWNDCASNAAGRGYICEFNPESTPPEISDVRITEIDGNGYTVVCTVTDNMEVDRVQFPTWTEKDGQDDLLLEWWTNPLATGTKNGNTYSFRVKDSDHNYERGMYHTHIYAYDSSGNRSVVTTSIDFKNEKKVVAETVYGGSLYQFFDDKMTWEEAKQICEDMGGHLVTITSAEEQQAIMSVIPNETTSVGYFIGGYSNNGIPCWVTEEPFEYTNWLEGEPNNSNGSENVYELYRNSGELLGKWNDCASNAAGRGFICEFDVDEVTAISLSETEISMGLGRSKHIEVSLSPEEGHFPAVVWSSEDEGVVTVADGTITAVGYGTAKICAECGGKQADCTVTVVKPIESISLDVSQKNLFKNETCKLEVSYFPTDANETTEIVWTSSNPQVVTVSEDGVVMAHSAGTAEILVTLVSDMNIQAVCDVTVESYVVSFETNGGTSVASVECGKAENLTSIEVPYKEGYAFIGWYKDAECTILWDEENDVVDKDLTLYAGWMEYHEGLWIVDIPAQNYTGKAVKPEVTVYHDNVKLVKGKDYTIKYKNNKNANEDLNSEKAPTVIVTGKGNYRGKETATFVILKKDLSDASISADDIFTSFNGRVQKPKINVKDNKKTLKAGKDYVIKNESQYMQTGSYLLTLEGKGNYTGTRQVYFTISSNMLISKASVSKIENQSYTGEEVKPLLVVKHNGRFLTENSDYTVRYENNIEVGTATAIINGINNYSGQKKISFKITGISMKQVSVLGITDQQYNGELKIQDNVKLYSPSGKRLEEGVDYSIDYKNNVKAGTATMIISGLREYSGTLKKTFKIVKYDMGTNSEGILQIDTDDLKVAYEKGGSKPDIKIRFKGKLLKNGQDYNLSYKNNQSVMNGYASAEVIISGKGNFSGTVTKYFEITTSNLEENVTMTVADKAYSPKKGSYKVQPVLIDSNNKKLTKGKDYSKELRYVLVNSDGTETELGKEAVLDVGSVVKVYADGIGNYTGTLSASYRITSVAFSKTKVKIATQEYTGKPVILDKSDITVKYNGAVLSDSDYEIVSYSNNIKSGTAEVVLKGVENYGGTKKVKFKISKKFFLWWWK